MRGEVANRALPETIATKRKKHRILRTELNHGQLERIKGNRKGKNLLKRPYAEGGEEQTIVEKAGTAKATSAIRVTTVTKEGA